MAVSHLWDRLEKCHKGFPGSFVKFKGGPIRALGLAQQGPRGGPTSALGLAQQGPSNYPSPGRGQPMTNFDCRNKIETAIYIYIYIYI